MIHSNYISVLELSIFTQKHIGVCMPEVFKRLNKMNLRQLLHFYHGTFIFKIQ